jgi:hypothetical protein
MWEREFDEEFFSVTDVDLQSGVTRGEGGEVLRGFSYQRQRRLTWGVRKPLNLLSRALKGFERFPPAGDFSYRGFFAPYLSRSETSRVS